MLLLNTQRGKALLQRYQLERQKLGTSVFDKTFKQQPEKPMGYKFWKLLQEILIHYKTAHELDQNIINQ